MQGGRLNANCSLFLVKSQPLLVLDKELELTLDQAFESPLV